MARRSSEGKRENAEEFYSLKEAADYAHICRQAIFVAIQKGNLKAVKKPLVYPNGNIEMRWCILRSDLDEYRKSKHLSDKRIVDGEKLFDIEDDRWSVLHASKTLSSMIGRPITIYHLYYLLRFGKLRGYKKGGCWIIKRQDLLELYEKHAEFFSDRQIKN